MTLSRAARSWSQLGVQVGLLLVGLGALQVVSERLTRRIDLTPTRSFSLTDVSRKVLAQVTAPLHVTIFFPRGRRAPYAETVARLKAAQPLIEYELYDYDRFPDKAKALGVTRTGSAALAYGANKAVVPALPEEPLVGGVLQVLRGERRRLAFTTGHGERAPGGGQEALGRLAAALDAENWAVEPLSLLDGAAIAHEVAAVVVAGPRHDLLPPELDRLAEYLKQGGGVLFLLDPGPLPVVQAFLASMGMKLGNDFVVERERRILGTDGLAAIVERFKPGNPVTFPKGHPIDTGAVLPSARTIDVVAERPGVAADVIAITDDGAWTMADPDRARRGEEPSKASHDAPGAAPVMAMAELGAPNDPERPPGRVVVVGDVDFASDAYLDLLGNRDLAMNAVAWVAGEETLAGERRKDVPEIFRPYSPLVVTDRAGRWILLTAAVVQPGLVLLLGVAVVVVRRRRG